MPFAAFSNAMRASHIRLSLAVPLLWASTGSAQRQASLIDIDSTGVSPRMERLARDVASQGPGVVNAFWTELEQAGTPLIEAIPGDSSRVLVTFVWRGAADTKGVQVSLMLALGQLHRLGATDIWSRTFTIRSDYRLAYAFMPTMGSGGGGPPQRDPLNRRVPVSMLGPNPMSVAELPRARPAAWVAKNPSAPAGRLEEREIQSAILTSEPHRGITIYTPAGYEARGAPLGYVIFMDAPDFLGSSDAASTILDNLIAEKRIPPLIAVFIHHNSPASASADLDNHKVFADFLGAELVPWLRRGWRVTTDPSHVIVCGASRGGLGAAYVAYRHPELFGNVLAESGAFWRGDEGANEPHEWLTQQMRNSPPLPIRYYMTVGTLETGLTPTDAGRGEPTFIDANRHFRDALRARRYNLEYHETPGGHEPLHWRSELPYGLMFLTAP